MLWPFAYRIFSKSRHNLYMEILDPYDPYVSVIMIWGRKCLIKAIYYPCNIFLWFSFLQPISYYNLNKPVDIEWTWLLLTRKYVWLKDTSCFSCLYFFSWWLKKAQNVLLNEKAHKSRVVYIQQIMARNVVERNQLSHNNWILNLFILMLVYKISN